MKVIAIIGLVATLSGCSDYADLSAENKRLSTSLSMCEDGLGEAVEKYKADIQHWRREAQIAQACDYIIPMCPTSMTAPGRAALAAQGEYSGGGLLFWALVAIKFGGIVMLVGFATALIPRLWLWIVTPARSETEAAQKLISSAQTKAAIAEDATRQAERLREEIENDIEVAEERLTEVQAKLTEVRAKLTEAKSELATVQAARDAVSGL